MRGKYKNKLKPIEQITHSCKIKQQSEVILTDYANHCLCGKKILFFRFIDKDRYEQVKITELKPGHTFSTLTIWVNESDKDIDVDKILKAQKYKIIGVKPGYVIGTCLECDLFNYKEE